MRRTLERQEHDYLFFTWLGNGKMGGPDALSKPPTGPTGPGYTVRKGRWKGMVPHCHDTKTWKPSWLDEMRLFDLEAVPQL